MRIQIRSVESQMEEARKRIEAQQKSLSQAEKALRISQTRYKSGIGTQLELLDTQVAMTRAQTNYSQAILRLSHREGRLAVLCWKPSLSRHSMKPRNTNLV